jgi:hypothetical protein
MQDGIADRWRSCTVPRVALRAMLAVVGSIAGALLVAGCSAMSDNPFTIFADPGKYQYNNCEQIATQRKYWSTREQELKMLMDKADQSAGGAVVNVLAYKADHVAANEELKVLESTARSKNCDTPANWKSNSTVR